MLSDWWNGVELWVLGLPFPFQFALVMAILVPLCLVVAWAIDRIVDHASALFGPAATPDAPVDVPLPEPQDGSGDNGDAEDPDRTPAASAGR